jgi:hypothetical protein
MARRPRDAHVERERTAEFKEGGRDMAFWCIDPINGSDATGSDQPTQAEAEQTPFKTWGAVRWFAGDTYLQRRGTTALEEVIVERSGEVGARITIDAYGENGNTPVIDGEGIRNNCVKLNGKAYITVRNLKLIRGTSGGCMQVLGNDTVGPDGVILEDLECSQNTAGDGINVSHNSPLAPPVHDIRIARCLCEDNGSMGIGLQGHIDGVLVDRCTVRRNGFATNAWGIYAASPQAKFAPGNWRRISQWIYELDLEPNETALTVNVIQSKYEYRRMRPGNFAALNPNEFAQDGAVVRFNPAEDISLHISNFPVRVKIGRLANLLVQECLSEDQLSFNGFDGTGMGLDIFAENSEFRRCTVVRPAKQGFSLNDTDGTVSLVGCEVIAPGQDTPGLFGAFFGARGMGTKNFINCTVLNCPDAAFRFADDGAVGALTTYEVHNALIENARSGLEHSLVRARVNSSGIVLHQVTEPGFAAYTVASQSNLVSARSPLMLRPDATAIGRGVFRTVADPRDRRGMYRVSLDAGSTYFVPAAPVARAVR